MVNLLLDKLYSGISCEEIEQVAIVLGKMLRNIEICQREEEL
jgi:hypothetical protein